MTPQSAITITAPIASEREAGLRELLATMNLAPGMADPHNALMPFYQFSGLHVARFVILEAHTNDDILAYNVQPSPWEPTLGFVADIDGPVDIFLAEMAVRAGPALRRIFSHCVDFDAESTNLLDWMKQHNRRTNALYANWRGRTVLQIREEQALARALREQAALLLQEPANSDPRVLRTRLLEFTDEEVATRRLTLTPPQLTPPG